MKLRKTAAVFVVLMILSWVSSCIDSSNSIRSSTPDPSSTQPIATAPTDPTVVASTDQTLPSPTGVPPLSIEEARSRLLDLLRNNGGCKLPCFWGITPGKSLFREVSTILMPLASISDFTSFESGLGAIYPDYYIEDDLKIKLNVSLIADVDNQRVNSINFMAGVLKREGNVANDVFDSPYLVEHLSYYLLPTILTQYGEPSQLMLSTMAKLSSTGVPGGFKILLLYPDHGMLVNYTMQMQPSGEDIMGCPSNSHVEFELYPPGDADSFFDLLERSGWTQIIQKTYKPLDEATSVSQEDFYRIFSQQTDECIRTPANIWPVPN